MASVPLLPNITAMMLLLAAAAAMWLHERGAFDAVARFLPHSVAERLLLAVVVVGFIHYGATKETNGVRGVSAPTRTGLITYALSHPNYLFGATEYVQTVRHCPFTDASEPPFPDDPWVDDGGDPYYYDDDDDDGDEPSGDGGEEYDSYEDAATNAVEFLSRVLYMRDPPEACDTIWLEAPTGYVNCCSCPDHWTNYVGVAYRSGRLRVTDSSGRPFESSETSCAVSVAGVHPRVRPARAPLLGGDRRRVRRGRRRAADNGALPDDGGHRRRLAVSIHHLAPRPRHHRKVA